MALSERFCDALVFAARLHANQRRKLSGEPYAAHLLRVAGIVLEHGADEDEAIAALLHDAVEDQGGAATGRLIGERFGRASSRSFTDAPIPIRLPSPRGASARRRIWLTCAKRRPRSA